MSRLSTNPPEFPMGSTESLPLGVDMTALLANGETISAPSATLTDLRPDGSANGTVGDSSVAGNVVTQTVSGLQVGHRYRLVVTFTAGGKTWATETLLLCEF